MSEINNISMEEKINQFKYLESYSDYVNLQVYPKWICDIHGKKLMEYILSKRTGNLYLKWPKYPKADKYKILYSNGRKSDFVDKNYFKVPYDVDIEKVSFFVQPFKGSKKLEPSVVINGETANFSLYN